MGFFVHLARQKNEKTLNASCMCVPAESIVEAALCKSVLKPLREPIYQSVEKLHTNDGSLKQLAQNQVGPDNWSTVTTTVIKLLHNIWTSPQ